MPLNDDTQWVHSSSRDNKNPDRDLGGVPSLFEISPYPMNNLFSNILPEEARTGLTDYRCFYILNNEPENYIRNVTLALASQVPGGADVEFGTFLQDEQQKLVITPLDPTDLPDAYGHVILDVHLGPPITVYWGTDISTFAANFQAGLQNIYMCSGCLVSATGAWEVTVDFVAEAGARSIDPITVIANRLDFTNGGSLRVFPAGETTPKKCPDDFSGTPPSTLPKAFFNTDTQLPLHPPVDPDSFPASGTAWAFNKCLNKATGGFVPISYTSLVNATDRTLMTLASPIGYYIEEMDEVYIEPKINDKFIVAVRKSRNGAPVNTISEAVPNTQTSPLSVAFGAGDIEIPWLRPLEGFYVWVKRTANPLTGPKGLDGFDFTLTGSVYS